MPTRARTVRSIIHAETRRLDARSAGSGELDVTVWTGDHGKREPARNCENWSSSGPRNFGVTGNARLTDGGWVAAQERRCTERARLYCFER